ncbi:MAG: methyltransferase [Candidatus Lokiarchaeota archaeon]|nr:methyltransferase [Candidatus Lokiarchaeota archaeon]
MNIPSLPDPIIQCDFENVYSPSDDSYLIIDYFKRKINQNSFDGIKLSEIKKILDLGTGTGIIAIFFQLIKMENPNFNPEIYGSDILEDSIKCTKLNEEINKTNNQINLIHSDLFKSFPEKLKHSFDIIIFNPPYLPSSSLIKENLNKQNIDYSWDGGLKGYELLIDFLTSAKIFLNLKKDHAIYCITSSRTNLIELNKLITNLGYKNRIVEKKHIFFEDIILNRFKTSLG